MKRALTSGLVATLVLGGLLSGSATAGKKPKKPKKVTRAVEMTYAEPSGVFIAGTGASAPAVTIPSVGSEKFISFTVTDDSGQKVGGSLAQNIDGGTTADDNQTYWCGSLENAPITGGFDVYVYITAGTCGTEAAPSTPTSGNLTGTLSNL